MAGGDLIKSIRTLIRRGHMLIHSSRGKDVLIYLLFLLVSYGFWVVMSLNDDSQRDIDVKLEITDVPPDIVFVSDVPKVLQVNVRDKGTTLAGYSWNGVHSLKLRYDEFTNYPLKDRIAFPEQELIARVRSILSSTSQVVGIRPDSLSLVYTDRPGAPVVVVPDVQVVPSPQCVISGPIKVSPDTVTVYSARHLSVMPASVKTLTLSRTNLKDTLVAEVRIHPENGVRVVPDRVTITVPVEPLIAKSRIVPITLLNGTSTSTHDIVMFPSQVTVSYLLPMSLYASENTVITVNADFYNRSGSKIPLTLGAIPDYYSGVSLSTDSIEYLIEQKSAFPASIQQ